MWSRTRSTTRSRTERGAVQPVEERPGQLRADRVVPEEMAVGERRRLADVVEQRRQPDDRPSTPTPHPPTGACGPTGPRPGPCSAGSRAAPRARREIGPSSPVSAMQPKPDRRRRRGEQLVELGGDPLARQVADQLGPCLDPGQRGGFDPELEGRRQPDGPDHPERVLLEPARRARRRRAGRARSDVEAPPYGSMSAAASPGRAAPGHRVDREVAARQVDLDRVAELDPVRPPEVGVVVVGAEGRDLEGLAVAPDGDRPEPVLVDRAREELDDALGQCVRREVPVVGRAPEDTSRSEPPTT